MQRRGARTPSLQHGPTDIAAADGGGSPGAADDETGLLKLPIVRELVVENERLMAEAAALRELRRCVAAMTVEQLVMRDTAERSVLAATEAAQRLTLKNTAHAALVAYTCELEAELAEADARNDELQGFMALAQQNLSVRDDDHADVDDTDEVNRRLSTSSADKENARPARSADTPSSPPPAKKARFSAGSADGRPSRRSLLTSPSELTKDRKTLHQADLAVTCSRR